MTKTIPSTPAASIASRSWNAQTSGVAILQALIAKLYKMRRDNTTFRVYSSALIEENKWRAVRYGLDGKLIDFGKQVELPAPQLIREFLDWFLGDIVDDLGTRKEVEYAYKILAEGSSADRIMAPAVAAWCTVRRWNPTVPGWMRV